DYRQKDAPRTDKCPPSEAPESQCLVYLDQFRTLAYVAAELDDGPPAAARVKITTSYQNQHERTQLFRDNGIVAIPGGTELNGRDDVHTLGLRVALASAALPLGERVSLGIDYGGDAYFDMIESLAWLAFTDVKPPVTSVLSRGQYIDGSTYLSSGLWAEPHLWLGPRVRLRAGGRAAVARARAPGDERSETAPVDRSWATAVGNAGLMVVATDWLTWHLDFDQGFRAPNLDDLTSRQQTGPGFQYENANLEPERSLSLDTGFRVRHRYVEASGFFWQSFIRDLIGRAPRDIGDCPGAQADPTGCAASRTRFQLVNLDGWALLRGVDASARVFMPKGFVLGATLSWAWGEGPNPIPPPSSDDSNYQERLPLSRVPPLNGTVEFTWYADFGLWIGSALRWATTQTRLALADQADIRIPAGGTPGFAVWDLRAGYRLDPHLLIGLVLENVIDSPYRYHGSSVNGAARSLNLAIEVGF
ncbi:MAG TPA: TonB-dependent receptor, partial [Enhygromyxa sp.]|nr:TonB-dependent receptor [Enhygromyxa sp.]